MLSADLGVTCNFESSILFGRSCALEALLAPQETQTNNHSIRVGMGLVVMNSAHLGSNARHIRKARLALPKHAHIRSTNSEFTAELLRKQGCKTAVSTCYRRQSAQEG